MNNTSLVRSILEFDDIKTATKTNILNLIEEDKKINLEIESYNNEYSLLKSSVDNISNINFCLDEQSLNNLKFNILKHDF